MIPQVAKALLDEYGKNASRLFDPYCGTGTSLIEANLKGIDAIGTDLNPFARLLAKVKTTPIEIQTLELHLENFYNYLFKFRFGFKNLNSIELPSFPRIDYWFSKKVKEKLAIIKQYIDYIENDDVADFFKVAFSQTIRDCSWTRNNEFKLYKMSPEQIRSFKPDAFGVFETILGKNYEGLKDYMNIKKNNSIADIFNFNTIKHIPNKVLKDESVDIIITSPPYGDSATTVAYGQFSALSNQWLGYMENGRKLDHDLMGGQKLKYFHKFNSEVLNDDIGKIADIDKKRALEVVSFYKDYERSIKNISLKMKKGGYACFVVSNRTVKGNILNTDVITKDFFIKYGFNHINTFNRKISSKRMPRRNSSLGVAGKTSPLMNTESIVVMQK